jgi:Flp pilus assembly pilin Flp
MTTTYVDAVGAARAWINAQTVRLVGPGKPLQKGAFLRDHEGSADVCYAVLTLLPGTAPGGAAESPQMYARISASVYGPTIEAITYASIGLADEILTYLAGQWTTVTTPSGPVQIWAGDDIVGPSDVPDGNLPRHVVDFTLVMQPALL